QFTIEFDPREGNFFHTAPPYIPEWQASVTSSNDAYPLTRALPVTALDLDTSKVWPELMVPASGYDKRVYRISFEVPANLPEDLFNLTVKAKVSGSWIEDSQPNALKVVNAFKDHFSFLQLTDIHVFGPENNYPSVPAANKTMRNKRHASYSEADGYGAAYYHKAIQQINVMHPDFVVLTGDYDFAQHWKTHDYSGDYGGTAWARTLTEYEFEQEWFYQETQKLQVPVFIVTGNHDGYNDDTNDNLKNFEKLYGPLYHSFDYGDYHFVGLNTMDWSSTDRTMINYLNIIQQPHKYKGQVKGGGDDFSSPSAPPESTYSGQLGWLRDDLKDHQGSKMRIALMHHDPWKTNGQDGSMWASGGSDFLSNLFGWAYDSGNGQGRRALMKLMEDYKVGLELSGHDHSDYIGYANWTGGGGQVKFVNTTSTAFQTDASSAEYPGYRRIWINDGQVESFSYKDKSGQPWYSNPWFKNTNVGGNTDLSTLTTSAVDQTWTPAMPGSLQDVTCSLSDYLTKSVPGATVEFPMPYLSGGYYYKFSGGSVSDSYDDKDSSPTHRTYRMTTDLDAGEANHQVRVYKSPTPDKTAPTGSVKINKGASATGSLKVKLDLSASDSGSGVGDMLVSNSSSFDGATWQPFRASMSWTLSSGGEGRRNVYVKYRDLAMPENESTSYSASVGFGTPEDAGPECYLAEGSSDYGFDTYVTIENPNSTEVTAQVTYMTKDGSKQRPDLKLPAYSQTVINPRADVGATDFSTKVTCKEGKTISVDRRMIWAAPGAPSSEGHASTGVASPAKTWYLPEGSSKWGFETWLLVQNPNDKDAAVKITYMIEGENPVVVDKTVKAKSRSSFSMAADIGQKDASIKVESSIPVIPERSMYRNSRREGHDSIGTTMPAYDYYLAEGTTDWGFTTYVLVQNPNTKPATVNITYMTDKGPVQQAPFTMDPSSRKTIRVNDILPAKDLSVKVHGSLPIIAERSMYWGAGTAMGEACHDSIGMDSPHMTFYLPDGETYNGTETWTLVQNPNASAVKVQIGYLSPTGKGNVFLEETIPANSRKTFSMGDKMPNGRAAIMVKSLQTGKPIMVERAMYWHSRGAGTDTIGGYSD
ncbi:MAG TPA: DUF5719 family protein, partial [Candidatus Anoxymicrobiaceae bacterium]